MNSSKRNLLCKYFRELNPHEDNRTICVLLLRNVQTCHHIEPLVILLSQSARRHGDYMEMLQWEGKRDPASGFNSVASFGPERNQLFVWLVGWLVTCLSVHYKSISVLIQQVIFGAS